MALIRLLLHDAFVFLSDKVMASETILMTFLAVTDATRIENPRVA